MSFLADTHVHIYPEFDLGRFFDQALCNLSALGEHPHRLLCLTETASCHAFEELKTGEVSLPAPYKVEPTQEGQVIRITKGEEALSLISGRQVVCAERLEILALGCLKAPEDHLPIREVIPAVEEHGGVPVLAWAPGKWMFKRKPIVESVVEEFGDRLWLGDSRLRCLGWPLPGLMKKAKRPILAGSDPLPVSGEEAQCGTFGISGDASFEDGLVWKGLKDAFADRKLQVVGQRNHALGMFCRLRAHSKAKHS